MSTASPLVSIILCVRNGLPHVREAVESVRALTYHDYELVVQDGASTDGTLEYLRGLEGFARLSIVSEKDSGIGQAFNRALNRCQGDIVGSVDADNRLHPGALDAVVREFSRRPGAAVVYGGCDMIAEGGAFIHGWTAPDFDLLALLDGSLVPPFATSFFSREKCGAALAYDEEFTTVADFDLWLRLAHLSIARIFDVLADVRVGPQSSTWTADMYERHCHFKIFALRRFIAGPGRDLLLSRIGERAEAGIHLWAVDSLATIGAGQDDIDRYFAKALETDLRSERFRRVVSAAHPTLKPQNSEVRAKVLALGIERLRQGQPEAALTYFELLQSRKVAPPTLEDLANAQGVSRDAQLAIADELLNQAKGAGDRERALTALRVALHVEVESALVRSTLQAEVDKRDELLKQERDKYDRTMEGRSRALVHELAEIARRVGILGRR